MRLDFSACALLTALRLRFFLLWRCYKVRASTSMGLMLLQRTMPQEIILIKKYDYCCSKKSFVKEAIGSRLFFACVLIFEHRDRTYRCCLAELSVTHEYLNSIDTFIIFKVFNCLLSEQEKANISIVCSCTNTVCI